MPRSRGGLSTQSRSCLRRQTGALPGAEAPAQVDRIVTGALEHGGREARANSGSAVDDDVAATRHLAHPLRELLVRDVKRARCVLLVVLAVLPDIEEQGALIGKALRASRI